MKIQNQHNESSNLSPDDVRQGVVIVAPHDGKFLMIRRAAGLLAGGAWCFVGGGIEPGELERDAAIREFSEEVGGVIEPVRKVWEYARPDGKLLLHWWLAIWDGGPLRANPTEVSELRWCTADEIARLPYVLDSNVQFMEEVGRGLLSG